MGPTQSHVVTVRLIKAFHWTMGAEICSSTRERWVGQKINLINLATAIQMGSADEIRWLKCVAAHPSNHNALPDSSLPDYIPHILRTLLEKSEKLVLEDEERIRIEKKKARRREAFRVYARERGLRLVHKESMEESGKTREIGWLLCEVDTIKTICDFFDTYPEE